MSEVVPRRERVRLETTAEIKQRAWSVMAEHGAGSMSLREIARQMGMAPSALYRYFAGRNELLTVLIVDAFDALAKALRTSFDGAQRRGADPHETWMAVARGYRRWALANRTEYVLIYSTALPDYTGNDETTAAAIRATGVLLDCLQLIVEADLVDDERIEPLIDGPYARQLSAWSAAMGRGFSPAALALAMTCWAALHGALHLEINDHFPPSVQRSAAQFEAIVDATARGMMKPLPR